MQPEGRLAAQVGRLVVDRAIVYSQSADDIRQTHEEGGRLLARASLVAPTNALVGVARGVRVQSPMPLPQASH